MTWPFENDTSAITKKLAKKSLQSEKRRNLMVVIAVALAAFLICFTGIVSTSLTQMQRNQVLDTYEAVWRGVEENDIENLKGVPEFERVGGYYMLGEELSEQGYHASYVYCDAQMMEIAKAQMNLLEGRVPEKANEVVVSEYFLSTYGNNAKIGDTVTLDTESFHGDYVVTGIMDSVNEKEANTCAIILSKAALTEWNRFDPAGYRAYAHFKNGVKLDEELMTSYCREITEEYQLPMPKMNSKYFAYVSKSFDLALMAGVIAIVLIGGYIVIQSIFRISINDKIKSYGQLRTIGATPKQIKRIVKREGRKLGSIGILIGTVLGVCGGFLLFPKGFNAVSYVATIILTLISSWIMVSVSIRKPIKIAAGISPIEAVRFTPAQKDIRSRKKNIKLNPVSMGIANFKRDRKKTVAIVASLSLGGIILLVVSSIVLLRSPEALARRFFPDGDYKIYLDSEMTEEKVMACLLYTSSAEDASQLGKLLGGIRLASPAFLGGVLFLRKKAFHVFLCPNQFLHLIPCLAVLRVSGFLLGQQFCELRIQRLDLRQFLQPSLVKGRFRRLVQSDLLPVGFQKRLAVPGFPISGVHLTGLSIVDAMGFQHGDFRQPCFCRHDGIAQGMINRFCPLPFTAVYLPRLTS